MHTSGFGRVVFLVGFLVTLVLAPFVVQAQMPNECAFANAQCSDPKSVAAKKPCGPCVVSGYTIPGICAQVDICKQFGSVTAPDGTKLTFDQMPQKVLDTMAGKDMSWLGQAGEFMSKNPLLTGIGIGAGTQLLSSLFSGSGSSGSGSNPYGSYGTGYCTTQYYYSSNPSATDPCAIYSSTGSGSTLPTTAAEDKSLTDLLNELNDNAKLPAGSSSKTSLIDVLNGEKCPIISSLISCASGEVLQEQGLDVNGCKKEPLCVAGSSSTLESVNLTPTESGTIVSVSDLIYNPNLYVDSTSGSTPDPSSTPLAKNEKPKPGTGLQGDLLAYGGGVTIYARSRTGNTEISGFYGGGSGSGVCKRRPWANNFLSYIIPPSFFDNLCAWSGFGQGSQGLISGSGLESGTRTVVGPRTPTTPRAQVPSDLVPEADIKAFPERVNLGGRTTIFWTSRNVVSCEESSSDGNFHGTSLAGGDSTVPFSGPVTFYIDCLGLSGERVRDSFTVQIGI